MVKLASVPEVVDVVTVSGARAVASKPADLLIEVPHGATRTDDFTAVQRRLTSPLPEGLVDFFHVNTDAGAPELGVALAERFVALEPERQVVLLRCRVPRTFIDCNRRIDAAPGEFKAGKVTPGLMPWVTTSEDRALLLERYAAYVQTVEAAAQQVMPQGAMLLLHTYAPRTVEVEVDRDIVANLRRAYAPDRAATWPLRPPVDVIGKALSGASLAPPGVVQSLREGLSRVPLEVGDSQTYPMHDSTLAYRHVARWPQRVVCLEVRRDLVADPFEPFAQMRIGAQKVQVLAAPMAEAMRHFWR